MRLIVGASKLDREVDHPDGLLISYRPDDGLRYLDFRPVTPPDQLVPEDLAVTILINSRVGPAAFKSVQDSAHTLDLPALPDKLLEQTSDSERQAVAEVAGSLAKWPRFAASVATKVLHKKRPWLIPIPDNQAILAAYITHAGRRSDPPPKASTPCRASVKRSTGSMSISPAGRMRRSGPPSKRPGPPVTDRAV